MYPQKQLPLGRVANQVLANIQVSSNQVIGASESVRTVFVTATRNVYFFLSGFTPFSLECSGSQLLLSPVKIHLLQLQISLLSLYFCLLLPKPSNTNSLTYLTILEHWFHGRKRLCLSRPSASPVPRTVPGAEWVLNKYLLNK